MEKVLFEKSLIIVKMESQACDLLYFGFRGEIYYMPNFASEREVVLGSNLKGNFPRGEFPGEEFPRDEIISMEELLG